MSLWNYYGMMAPTGAVDPYAPQGTAFNTDPYGKGGATGAPTNPPEAPEKPEYPDVPGGGPAAGPSTYESRLQQYQKYAEGAFLDPKNVAMAKAAQAPLPARAAGDLNNQALQSLAEDTANHQTTIARGEGDKIKVQQGAAIQNAAFDNYRAQLDDAYANDTKTRYEAYNAQSEQRRAELEKDAKTMNPWKRLTGNAASTILSSIGLALSGLGGLSTDRGKSFDEFLDRTLNREFEIQKEALANKRFAMTEAGQDFQRRMQAASNVQQAKIQWISDMKNSFANAIDAKTKELDSPLAAERGAILANETKRSAIQQEQDYNLKRAMLDADVQKANAQLATSVALGNAGNILQTQLGNQQTMSGISKSVLTTLSGYTPMPYFRDPVTKQEVLVPKEMSEGLNLWAQNHENALKNVQDLDKLLRGKADLKGSWVPGAKFSAAEDAQRRSQGLALVDNLGKLGIGGTQAHKLAEALADDITSPQTFGKSTQVLREIQNELSQALIDKQNLLTHRTSGADFANRSGALRKDRTQGPAHTNYPGGKTSTQK